MSTTNTASLKEILELKLFLIQQMNKGNFTVHPMDILEKVNKVLDYVDSERKP